MSIINTALIGKMSLDMDKRTEDTDNKEFKTLSVTKDGVGRFSSTIVNPNSIAEDVTVYSGSNAMMVGPIDIDGTLTIEDGSTLVIV